MQVLKPLIITSENRIGTILTKYELCCWYLCWNHKTLETWEGETEHMECCRGIRSNALVGTITMLGSAEHWIVVNSMSMGTGLKICTLTKPIPVRWVAWVTGCRNISENSDWIPKIPGEFWLDFKNSNWISGGFQKFCLFCHCLSRHVRPLMLWLFLHFHFCYFTSFHESYTTHLHTCVYSISFITIHSDSCRLCLTM